MIAFVGSVFSPYYARARRQLRPDPENHCAINVALYGKGGKRWAMTERGRAALVRDAASFKVGPSSLEWTGTDLSIRFDEWTVPFPRRIRGRISLKPPALTRQSFALDHAGRHRWQPIAPISRVEVKLDDPQLSWSGHAYFDHNWGCEPLEQGFKNWDWSRSSGGLKTAIFYDVTERTNKGVCLAIEVDQSGQVTMLDAPPRAALPHSHWRIARTARSDRVEDARVLKTLEDTPFYARSLVSTSLNRAPVTMFHESLDLDRFKNPVVQLMLPFRMPRRSR